MKRVWLTCIIALPEKLFFNTGIATYIWILTNWYFYQYTPLRSLKEITDELLKLERESEGLLNEVLRC
jgi:type I restriction enzyme M protein